MAWFVVASVAHGMGIASLVDVPRFTVVAPNKEGAVGMAHGILNPSGKLVVNVGVYPVR